MKPARTTTWYREYRAVRDHRTGIVEICKNEKHLAVGMWVPENGGGWILCFDLRIPDNVLNALSKGLR